MTSFLLQLSRIVINNSSETAPEIFGCEFNPGKGQSIKCNRCKYCSICDFF